MCKFIVCIILLFVVSGCATKIPVTSNQAYIDENYIGYWTNTNPIYQNWWVIERDSIVNYGTAPSGTRCSANNAIIISPHKIDVTHGNKATAELLIYEGLLIFKVSDGFSAHKKIQKTDICRKINGDYFEGAPYPL